MTTAHPVIPRNSVADSAGMLASIACAIHCAAMPLVIGYLPILGLGWLADESFHQVMAVVCFGLAAVAFIPGWQQHGSLLPLATGIAGVSLLSLAAFGLEEACCPSCAATDPTQIAAPVCENSACESCNQAIPSQDVAPPGPTTFPSWAVPFMTPIGGMLLVLGHLVNHRKSCACRDGACCLS